VQNREFNIFAANVLGIVYSKEEFAICCCCCRCCCCCCCRSLSDATNLTAYNEAVKKIRFPIRRKENYFGKMMSSSILQTLIQFFIHFACEIRTMCLKTSHKGLIHTRHFGTQYFDKKIKIYF